MGVKNIDICRKYGISEQTFYRWKSKYGGMEVSEAKRLKSQTAEAAKGDEDAGRAKLKELTKAGRYQRDVY